MVDSDADDEVLASDRDVAATPRRAVTPRRDVAPGSLEALAARVNEQYGAFGVRATNEAAGHERRVLLDSGWRSIAWTLMGILSASTLLAFASQPAWAGPGEWATSLRLDAVFVVVWAPLLCWAMARQQLWKSLRVYLVLALFIEAFSEVMFLQKGEGGYWDSVMWPAAVAFYGTIKELTGLPGASLPVFFFVTVGLLGRAVWGRKPAGWIAPPRFARDALLVFLGTVVVLSAIGVARGGQFDGAFRQTLHMLQLPLVGLLFLYALRVPQDLAAVGAAFVLTAVVRSLLVVYVYVGVCAPKGVTLLPGKPEWCTTHSDTVLFVSALIILFAHALEQRSRDAIVRGLAFGAIIFLGVILNNRRLAFVSLALAPLVIYLALDPSRRKRRITAALAVLVPLLVGYVLVGAESPSDSPLLKPAKSVVSLLDQGDNSALSRDIENENLIYTLAQSAVLARGFGHEYLASPSNPPVDLSQVFENYRLIAHNGVLWLWSIAGVVGFSLLWLVYPLAGTLALRGYRAAGAAIERSAALASLGCVAVCVVQIWGDQGLSSYMTLVTFGVAFAVASRLATRAA